MATLILERLLDAGEKVFAIGNYMARYKKTEKTFNAWVAHINSLKVGKVRGFKQFTDSRLLTGSMS